MAGQVVVSAVAGAGFEIIFDNLLQGFLTALKNNSQFKPSLKRLEGMLEDMAPHIKRMESFKAELDQPVQLERLKGLMTKGNDLVNKCSKIHKHSFWKKPLYNLKLLKLEKDIRDHISTVLQLQEVGDTRGVSSGVRQLSDQIGRLTVDSISNNTAATSQDQQKQQHHRSSSSSCITASPATSQDQQQQQHHRSSSSSSITASPDQIFPTATTLQSSSSSCITASPATSQDQQQQQHHRSSSSSSITASPDQIFPTATTLQNGNSSYMEITAACKSESNQPP